MTVTGATTAQQAAQTYTPPFKYVTSYAPAPQITGTIAGSATSECFRLTATYIMC